MGEHLLRFLIGGAAVSLFAALGEVTKPKTFAGIFGAAPSVMIGTLGLAFATNGSEEVLARCRAMPIGIAALFIYSALCVWIAKRRICPIWFGALLAWAVWFAVASFGFWMGHNVLACI